MWFLIKSGVGLVAMVVAAYVLFFVDMAGKPLSSHIADVWSSQAVQAKVDLVRDGVRNELEDRLAAVAEREARQAVRDHLGERRQPAPEEIADEDRDALNDVIAAH